MQLGFAGAYLLCLPRLASASGALYLTDRRCVDAAASAACEPAEAFQGPSVHDLPGEADAFFLSDVVADFLDEYSVLVEVLSVGLAFVLFRHFRQAQKKFSHAGKGGNRPAAALAMPKRAMDLGGEARPEAPSLQSGPEAWRQQRKACAAFSSGDLLRWAGKILDTSPDTFVEEFRDYLADTAFHSPSERASSAYALMEAAAKAGRHDIVKRFVEEVESALGIELERPRVHQALLHAHSAAGDIEKVEEALDKELQESPSGQVSSRSLATVARGYLKAGDFASAKLKLEEMRQSAFQVPTTVFHEWARNAWKDGSVRTVLAWMDEFSVPLTSEIHAGLLEGCAQTEDAAFAAAVEQRACDVGISASAAALAAMLKVRARTNDGQAAETIRKIKEIGFKAPENFWKTILWHCVESKHVECAEAIHAHLRGTPAMTYTLYKCLMKVYAYAGKYDRACDLYEELTSAGHEADAIMCSSLVKFAFKAGRSKLSKEMFERCADSGGCVRNHMWLIRAASKEGDVARALGAFEQLKQELPHLVDPIAYNIVIDACACNRDMAAAERVAEEMRAAHGVNVVTYNTLIKGYCLSGDLAMGKRILHRLEAEGFTPDAASFCCILSLAAKSLNVKEVWNTIAGMDRHGVPLDSFSASLLMQAARKAPKPKDGNGLLTLMDRTDFCIVDDQVIFNSVLDACIYRRDRRRLSRAVNAYSSATFTPSGRTYGLLIQACAMLHRSQRCWELWEELTARGDIKVNEALFGLMIDALVESRQVAAAYDLFQQWRTKVDCDAVIPCTLIKGFAKMDEPDKAMAVYEEMKAAGAKMNVVAYTALINANCRRGFTKRAEALLEEAQASGFKPNAVTYASLIRGHCLCGDLHAALSIFHTMSEKGFQADNVIYNTLLDGCVQNSNFQLADELLELMKERQVTKSNYTLSTTVKMWSRRGDLDKAFEALNATLSDDTSPPVDAQVGACIVGACMHNRAPDRALKVFEEMKRWPNFDGPDVNTYSSMIGGLARHGQARQSVRIAEEACEALRASPEEDQRCIAATSLTQMFKALRHERLQQEVGYPLFQKLKAAGQPVDSKWLNRPWGRDKAAWNDDGQDGWWGE